MICIETQHVEDGSAKKIARLVSTLPGQKGTRELISFGREIGLHPSWLEEKGTPKEHFPLWDKMLERALQKGAKRGMHDLSRVNHQQREFTSRPP